MLKKTICLSNNDITSITKNTHVILNNYAKKYTLAKSLATGSLQENILINYNQNIQFLSPVITHQGLINTLRNIKINTSLVEIYKKYNVHEEGFSEKDYYNAQGYLVNINVARQTAIVLFLNSIFQGVNFGFHDIHSSERFCNILKHQNFFEKAHLFWMWTGTLYEFGKKTTDYPKKITEQLIPSEQEINNGVFMRRLFAYNCWSRNKSNDYFQGNGGLILRAPY